MKKIFIFLSVLATFSIPSFAQINLNDDQIKTINRALDVVENLSKIDSTASAAVSEKASWGKEIGVAVDGALSAVESHVTSIADSNLGHTVTFLVVWRFLFKDVIGLIVGIFILIIMIWIIKKLIGAPMNAKFNDWDEYNQMAYLICGWLCAVILFASSMACIF